MLNYYLQKLKSMISFKAYFYWLLLLGLPLISISYLSCSSAAFSNFNLLPIEQDVELGKEVEKEIAADPKHILFYPRMATNKSINTYVVLLQRLSTPAKYNTRINLPGKSALLMTVKHSMHFAHLVDIYTCILVLSSFWIQRTNWLAYSGMKSRMPI